MRIFNDSMVGADDGQVLQGGNEENFSSSLFKQKLPLMRDTRTCFFSLSLSLQHLKVDDGDDVASGCQKNKPV